MIKALVVGLLVGAGLVPAASAQQGTLRDAMRARMQARVEARGDAPRGPGPQAAAPVPRGDWNRPDRPERVDTGGWARRDPGNGGRGGRAGWRAPPVPAPAPAPRPDARPGGWGYGAAPAVRGESDRSRAEWRSGRDRSPGWDGRDDARTRVDGDWRSARSGDGWQRRDRDDDAWQRRDRGSYAWSNGGNGRWGGRDDRARWDRDWRRDQRYDWSGYRSSNRYAYRLPRYYAPYGWGGGYTRFGIGVRIAPTLFARSYWIDDPYAYRLPDAYGPYRWVRYYDDALLVDLDSGQVVDVIYDIFW
ncbi:RcnB family protein [Sphingomonas citri]|nr:RcnB family protein [Sphingomonas citri]